MYRHWWRGKKKKRSGIWTCNLKFTTLVCSKLHHLKLHKNQSAYLNPAAICSSCVRWVDQLFYLSEQQRQALVHYLYGSKTGTPEYQADFTNNNASTSTTSNSMWRKELCALSQTDQHPISRLSHYRRGKAQSHVCLSQSNGQNPLWTRWYYIICHVQWNIISCQGTYCTSAMLHWQWVIFPVHGK